ncbi:MAG: OsmC family protein [Gemmatimonadaceae bacterium]
MSTITPTPVRDRANDIETFTVSLQLLDASTFRVDFEEPGIASLTTDEPSPLGLANGPSPSRLLAAAVTNCLAASLLHCLRRARVPVEGMEASAVTTIGRNASGRLRIQRIAVQLDPRIPADQADRLTRCQTLFEDYCTVTASVRDGIDVRVVLASN